MGIAVVDRDGYALVELLYIVSTDWEYLRRKWNRIIINQAEVRIPYLRNTLLLLLLLLPLLLLLH